MRILNLRFRNLNSLAGDWSIDFQAPEYEAGGIFAITGPTGAGKSTILDAICLALYGSTPRLGKVSKGANDIMTRHCGDCSAEVTFRTSHGDFRCVWTQHRARKKADGELQPPQHKIFDAEGRAIADKIQDVARKVEELTGMDFERFTQSTLLAQGRFAAFLLADGSERAPLLEQMTGTGIYSDISRYVFERHKAEQEKLAALERQLSQDSALSEEEEAGLRASCARHTEDIAAFDKREAGLSGILTILRTHAKLTKEYEDLLVEKAALEEKLEAFRPDRMRLETARRALPLAGDCSALLARKAEHRRDSDEAERLRGRLGPLEADIEGKKALLAAAEQTLSEKKQDQINLAETLKTVRELDLQLKAYSKALAACAAARADAERTKEKAERRLQDYAEQKGRLHREKLENETWLAEHHSDGDLPLRLASMRTTYVSLEQQEQILTARGKTIQEKDDALAALLPQLDACRTSSSALRAGYTELEGEAADLDQRREALLEGRPLSEWRSEKNELSALAGSIDAALEALLHRKAMYEQIAKEERHSAELAKQIQETAKNIADTQERLTEMRQFRDSLAESISLLERIRSYEEERLHLQDGKPCPLCGSVHHPFAEGSIPAVDEKQRRLQECAQKLQTLTEEQSQRRASLAALERDAEHIKRLLQEKCEEAENATSALLSRFQPLTSAIAILPADIKTLDEADHESLRLALEQTGSTLRGRLGSVESLVTQCEALDEDRTKIQKKLDSARDEMQKADQKASQLETSRATLSAERMSLAAEQDSALARQEKEFDALRLKLTSFGVAIAELSDASGALALLDARSLEYCRHKDISSQLAESCANLEKLHGIEEKNLENATDQLQKKSAEEDAAAKTHSIALYARQELFGDKNADIEEANAAAEVLAQEKICEGYRTELDAVLKQKSDTEGGLAALAKSLAERTEQLAENENALHLRLEAAGFHTLEECLAACLSDDCRHTLEEQERTLSEGTISVQTRLAECIRKKDEMQELPNEREEDLNNSLDELKAQRAALREELGALREKLESNEKKKLSNARLLSEKAAQEKHCRRWAELNLLIGSAEGKKFRNYAQGLTFRMLIGHANRQLASLTDRYQLVQDPKEPLALCVVDRYQADAVRTSRNLSGGESFLVSLSLALGLARMASRSVRVDSVFLDEGFGTLDEDSLNLALDMLSNLRQQGKTIGLISHVQAIRDRISVLIRVEPAGNGRSRITGPGINRPQAG